MTDDEVEARARRFLGKKQTGVPWATYYTALARLITVTTQHQRAAERAHKAAARPKKEKP